MQPLAYQMGESTCWPTSITNGIMFLRDGLRIESFEYKTLHASLNSALSKTGVSFDDYSDQRDLEQISNTLGNIFSIKFVHIANRDVADVVRKLHFKNQVAICDVGNGDHSILLNGRSNSSDWFSAFDPWWYNNNRTDNENVQFPDETIGENVRIRQDHLLNDSYRAHRNAYMNGLAYPMGRNIDIRFLTVMERDG